MIKEFGSPTWFLTLSANDMNWPDLMEILCNSEGLNCAEETITMSKSQKVQMMNRNPILTERHFAHRIHSFIHNVILSKHTPIGSYLLFLENRISSTRHTFRVVG